MLSKRYRFHGRRSLNHVYRSGQVVRGPLFSLKYIRHSKGDYYRCAVVVSKKVSKSAVVRNRIRRRLYELFRLYLDEQTPFDVVCSVFSDQVASMPADELRLEFHKQMKLAKLAKRPSTDSSHAIIDKKEN